MKKITMAALASALVLTCSSLAGVAEAESYPSKPIRMIIPFDQGGGTSALGRFYQTAIVENKFLPVPMPIMYMPGAGGTVGAREVLNAAPDGYTLLLFSGAQHATVPALSDSAIYDPVGGAQPVAVVFNFTGIVAVPADSPANSIAELVALAKTKPQGLNFGSPGAGTPSHLASAKLLAATGAKGEFIHYKGGSPMMADLLGGRLDVAWPSAPSAKAFLESKKIKALAIDGAQRWALVPQVPTLAEAGFGDVSVANWFAVAASPGTPPAIIAKLNAAFAQAGRDPVLKQKIEALGLSVATSTPEELGRLMAKEAADIRALVAKLGLRQ